MLDNQQTKILNYMEQIENILIEDYDKLIQEKNEHAQFIVKLNNMYNQLR